MYPSAQLAPTPGGEEEDTTSSGTDPQYHRLRCGAYTSYMYPGGLDLLD